MSYCGGHAPRLQAPLPHKRPCSPLESRGACPLTGAPLCPLHLGAPAPPSGPVWRVCWPRLSRSLSQNVPVCTGAAAVLLLQVTALLSLRLHLHPWWVWTASPPSISHVSPLSLERSHSALCGKAHQPCGDSRLSFGSHPRGPHSTLRSPGLLTVRRSPPPSCACGVFTAQSSTLSLGPGVFVGRVFSLYCGSYFPAALQAW